MDRLSWGETYGGIRRRAGPDHPVGYRIQVSGFGPKQTNKQPSPSSVTNSRPQANSGFGRAWPRPQEARANQVGGSRRATGDSPDMGGAIAWSRRWAPVRG